jgi:hypothetical protein
MTTPTPVPSPWLQQVLKDIEDEEKALAQMPSRFTRDTGMVQPVLDPGPDPDAAPTKKSLTKP